MVDISALFQAMSADFETMAYYGDDESALLKELETATPDILETYAEIFL